MITMTSERCQHCGMIDWHNDILDDETKQRLCQSCGYPNRVLWEQFIDMGYIKPARHRPSVEKYLRKKAT